MATRSAVGGGPSVVPVKLSYDSAGSVPVADGEALFLGDYSRHGHDLVIEHNGTSFLVQDYFAGAGANLVGPTGAFLTPSVVEALAGPAAPGQYAQAGTAPAATALVEIGKVVSVEGTATATHSDGVTVNLAKDDPVYQGDVVRTGAESKLGISFIDDSVFSLSADARMVLDELVFDPAKAADGSMVVNLVQGSFVFVTGQIAPTGNMKVETPVATMGIRGTTPKVLINTDLGVTEFTILPDPGSGKIGSYLLIDKTTGEILGTVESVGDKWVITSLSDEAVKVAKSGLDLLEDERALADIRDAVSNALGKRAEYDGSNSFQQVAFDSSSSAGDPDGTGGPSDGGAPGGGDGGVVDPTPDKDDPPIAGDDAFATHEEAVLVGGNVLNASGGGADVDPDGFALTVTQVNGDDLTFTGGTDSVVLDSGAILVIGQTGGITYDPNDAYEFLGLNDVDTDIFTYTTEDQFQFSDTATVRVTVTGRNDRPEIEEAETVPADGFTELADNDPLSLTPDTTVRTADGVVAFEDVDASDTHVATVSAPVVTWTKDGGATESLDEIGSIAIVLTESAPDTSPNLEFAPDGTLISVPSPVTGEVEWTYTVTESDLDFLAAGETLELVYTIRITDDSGVGNGGSGGNEAAWIERDVKVTITGTNDVPVITAGVVTGTIDDIPETADEDPSGSAGDITATGSISFADVDLTDRPTAEVTGSTVTAIGQDNNPLPLTQPQIDAIEAAFSISPDGASGSNTNNGTVTWDYTIDESEIDFLGAGEVVTAVFTITVTDDEGATDTQQITITITGASATGDNDAPVITIVDVTGAVADVAEAAGVPPSADAGMQTTSGSISFADVDLTDRPVATEATASVTATKAGGAPLVLSSAQQAAIEAAFSITPDGDSGSNTNNGTINWTYAIAESSLDFLAAGETVTAVFTITVTDDEGEFDTQDVTITITGANDEPVVTAVDVTGAVTELVTPVDELTDSGTISFTDVDLTDVHLVSPTGTPVGSVLGSLSALKNADTTGTGTGGQLTWTYTVDAADVEYLAEGETRLESFTITVSDQHGGVITRQIDVTITGTNDQPVITTQDLVGGVTERAETAVDEGTAVLTDTGTIEFGDVDLTDSHVIDTVAAPTVAPSAGVVIPGGGPLGTFVASVTTQTDADGAGGVAADGVGGVVTWTFTVSDSAVEFLAAGESVTQTYTVVLNDQNSQDNTVSRDVVITITGTNDTPIIAAITQTDLDEQTDGNPLTANIAVTFTDVDLNDVGHEATVTGVTVDGEDGGLTLTDQQLIELLTPQDMTKTSGSSAGSVTLAFSAASTVFDYLAVGETVTLTYTVEIDDGDGGTDSQTFDVVITGTNDAPVVAAVAETITIPFTANVRPAETYGTIAAGEELTGFVVIDAASGEAISFEVHHATEGSLTSNTVAVNFLDNFGGGANDLIVIQGTNVTGTLGGIVAGAGSIVISLYGDPSIFSGGSVPFDQTIWNSFTDDRLLSLPAPSNPDATTGIGDVEPFPDFVIGGAAASAIAELVDGDTDENNYEHLAAGSIAFSDVDVSDTHTVSFDADAGNPIDLGSATFTLTNPGSVTADGNIGWEFTVDDADLDFLAAGETREFTYTVTIDDGNGGTDTQDVVVTVTGTNDAPVVAAQTLSGTEDDEVTGTVGASDVDSSELTYALVAASAVGGTVTSFNTETGEFTFTADEDFSGTASFQVIANDGLHDSAPGTLTIDVSPEADAPLLTLSAIEADGVMRFGDEFTVNMQVENAEYSGDVVSLDDGRVLFVWRSDDPDVDGSGGGVSARVGTIQADGSITWDSAGEFTVNALTTATQENPRALVLGDGRVLVTWTTNDLTADGSYQAIAYRTGVLQSDGSIGWDTAGEQVANAGVTNSQLIPQVTELDDGRLLFTWQSSDPGIDSSPGGGIAARVGTLQPDGTINWGTAGEFAVNVETSSYQNGVQVVDLGGGKVLFTWTSNDLDVDGNGTGVSARVGTVGANGGITWASAGEITVNQLATGDQYQSQATLLGDGRVLFVWSSADLAVDGNNTGISARIGTVLADGSISWSSAGEFTVNQETTGAQGEPQVTALADGRILFTWQSDDADVDGATSAISARIGTVQPDGSISWDTNEFAMNERVVLQQMTPVVTTLEDGRVVAMWGSWDPAVDGNGTGIAARVLSLGMSPEDQPVAISIDATVADTDGSELVDFVRLSGFPAGATFSLGHADGSTWIIDDDAELAQLASTPLTMTPPLDWNGTFTLSAEATVLDSATLTTGAATETGSTTAMIDITIFPTNDAPEVEAGWEIVYHRGDAAKQIDVGLTITDVDDTQLIGATVAIGDGFVAGEDRLSFVDQFGIVGSYDDQTGILTLSGVASLADYQAALRSVTYVNLEAETNTSGSREIIFAVDDGVDQSVAATSIVYVSNAALREGDDGPNTLTGDGYPDDIYGFGGADQLMGGAGDDWLFGGDGSDTLTGGDGPDRFFFLVGETGVDTITDFDTGDDFINLESLLSVDFDPETPQAEIRLTETAPGSDDSILQVHKGAQWIDVAVMEGISAGETISIIYDQNHEAISFANVSG